MPPEILLFISSVRGEMLTAVHLKGTQMNEVILSQVFHLEWESKRIMAHRMSYFTTLCLQRHDFQSGTELLLMATTVAMAAPEKRVMCTGAFYLWREIKWNNMMKTDTFTEKCLN